MDEALYPIPMQMQKVKTREYTDAEIEGVARVCHDANRAWCLIHGDDSQPSWEDAPDGQKQSDIAGVRYHLENPHASDRDSHDKWLEAKLRDGWRYGPTQDAAAKTHPCLLPFDALDTVQQTKDSLFRAIVRGWATINK